MVIQQLQFSVADIRINILSSINWHEADILPPVAAINFASQKGIVDIGFSIQWREYYLLYAVVPYHLKRIMFTSKNKETIKFLQNNLISNKIPHSFALEENVKYLKHPLRLAFTYSLDKMHHFLFSY